ncbi:aa3-type cytochrome c oxidase subunit IV [Pseudooceanicola sp.]
MAEHKHGEMDITVQEKTFEGFIKVSSWVAGLSILLLIFMALVNG